MFEAEIEMEKKSANWLPLVLIILLVLGLAGGIGYVVYQNTHGQLTPDAATAILTDALKLRPATTQFHTGTVVPTVNDKPDGAHYRLLQKAGYVKVAPAKGLAKLITLTAEGEKIVSAFPEFKPAKESDGSMLYTVPLAARKLVGVTNVTMNGVSVATVEYTWKWEPTPMGDLYDANGKTFNTFPAWDRQTLIQKYNAEFFHGEPTKSTVRMIKTDKGWKLE